MPMNDPVVQVIQTIRFEKDIERLRKKYRRIDKDVLPLINKLEEGATPGTRIPGVSQVVYKERIPNSPYADRYF